MSPFLVVKMQRKLPVPILLILANTPSHEYLMMNSENREAYKKSIHVILVTS